MIVAAVVAFVVLFAAFAVVPTLIHKRHRQESEQE